MKEQLIEKLIKKPFDFTAQDFDLLVHPETKLTFIDLREALKRVYNISESSLLTQSDATKGPIGIYNRFFTKRRKKKYFSKINDGFTAHPGNRVIVAEGDSWFQFLGKDIINFLAKRSDYAIYTIAYAGDWLANIIFEEKYIEELSIHKPSAYLISGGGNDLVGGNRLAIMTCKNPDSSLPVKRNEKNELLAMGCTSSQADAILSAQAHILPEFYAFLLVLKCQYYLMFSNLRRSKDFQTMAIITQGYDYSIPFDGFRFDLSLPWQPLLNKLLGSGKWLSQPLMIRGIKDQNIQRAIVMAMIFEFNEMFLELASMPQFPYLYHIDSRGNARDSDWFDELHLKPKAFSRVADAYHRCLQSHFEHLMKTSYAAKNPNYVFYAKDAHG